ncbi:MAG TPA: 4-(cytidine 5'-diphospho)-2-C-methyl-D-erythritol kinase [Pyrinomonadaceae bacterium]|nr:4-(cytidine 5'-diphospho)-2-C-methyl-D-erythritol kinase [Pyrinomonadaceae bacterium]
MNQSSIRLPSFAKINLSLRVLGKRPDGYHEISTTLQTISLHDDLLFERNVSGEISLSCDEPEIPLGAENLAVQAARALKDHYSPDVGADIRLHKRIPAKAGLGGGSSNAAVTLLALNHLWQINASAVDLAEIAADLGADVPFFLHGGSAKGTGTGTTITPLPDDEVKHLIVLHPRASVSTVEAYRALNSPALTSNNPIPILAGSPDEGQFSESNPRSVPELENDFELVIFDIEPEIKRAKSALITAGAQSALLAGSGSSVFGIFANREKQQRAVNEIQLEPGWRVFDCVTVSRFEYDRALSL